MKNKNLSIIPLFFLFSFLYSNSNICYDRGDFAVRLDKPRQVIWGLGFEIQSDAISSGNQGLPNDCTSVPHDLVPAERERFYKDMLTGFRYCRLAGGLYLRGLTADKKHIQGRWPEQMGELKEMVETAGIEGLSWEYWSPAPYWKANGKYTGDDGSENTLKCYGSNFKNDPVYQGNKNKFFQDFAAALVKDIQFLQSHGFKISMWGLQNEPPMNTKYSSCKYTNDQFHESFKAIAPAIRNHDQNILIMCDSWEGQRSAKKINEDVDARKYVDAWVWHQIGYDANTVIDKRNEYLKNIYGRPVFQNEYEYLEGPASAKRCLNTTLNMMNWFTFVESPTWFWIHALKPTYNIEASGYSLGFWRPWDDDVTTDIKKGYWKYNEFNWISLAGFVKHMPWDSRRYTVDEDNVRYNQRILAVKTPKNKLIIFIGNRGEDPFTFAINTGMDNEKFLGYRYTPFAAGTNYTGVPMGVYAGKTISPTLPSMAYEVWISAGNDPIPDFFLPPDILLATNVTHSQVNFKWTNKSMDQEGLYLERAIDSGKFLVIDTLAPDVTTFSDNNLDCLTKYTYRLRAFKQNNVSHYSTMLFVNTLIDPNLKNLALRKPVQVDSKLNDYTGDKAVDGDNSVNESRWVSANQDFPHWISIDLQGEYYVNAMRFWTGFDGYNFPIHDFKFQYLNHTTWTDFFSVKGNTLPGFVKKFAPVKTNKVRLYMTKAEDKFARIYEIEVYGTENVDIKNNGKNNSSTLWQIANQSKKYTIFNFKLSNEAYVKLKLFNILGQEVSMLVNRSCGVGNHTVRWVHNNLSKGIFLAKLYINDSDTKALKIIIF